MHLSQVAADRLLLVHISGDHRAELHESLTRLGFEVHQCDGIESALPLLTQEPTFSTVLMVADGDGMRMRTGYDALIHHVQAIRRASSFSQIVLTVDASVDISLCCEAVNNGVAGFVEIENGTIKPDTLRRRLEYARRRFEIAVAEAKKLHSGEVFEGTGIVGCSSAMAGVLSQAARASQVSDAPVLIFGESGTGKQLLAEMIHKLDPKRCKRPFLSVNCAAIAGTLAESALFGHVKGAYTGATETRAGYFRAADGGTIFLDEITELAIALQPKLLRVLQEGMVLPVGSDQEHEVDVRVIAASNRRVPALIEEDKFRLDLYQRLNVISLDIPPLRERREDIPLLIDFFVKKYAQYYDKTVTHVEKRVYELLSRCALHGNVRELENTVRRALAIKTDGDELTLADLPGALIKAAAKPAKPNGPILSSTVIGSACDMITSGAMTLPEFIDECERLVLDHAIQSAADGHADLSRRLGLSTRTLYNKRRKHQL